MASASSSRSIGKCCECQERDEREIYEWMRKYDLNLVNLRLSLSCWPTLIDDCPENLFHRHKKSQTRWWQMIDEKSQPKLDSIKFRLMKNDETSTFWSIISVLLHAMPHPAPTGLRPHQSYREWIAQIWSISLVSLIYQLESYTTHTSCDEGRDSKSWKLNHNANGIEKSEQWTVVCCSTSYERADEIL